MLSCRNQYVNILLHSKHSDLPCGFMLDVVVYLSILLLLFFFLYNSDKIVKYAFVMSSGNFTVKH